MNNLFTTPAAFTTPYCDRFGRVLLHVAVNNWGQCYGYMTDRHLPWTWRTKTTSATSTAIRWDTTLKGLAW
jgi:uncharacterized protein with PIN domain